jgi:hypothetical protein
MEPEGLLSRSQDPTAGLYFEPPELVYTLTSCFFKNNFGYYSSHLHLHLPHNIVT